MAATVGDYALERLRDWGVEQVFGYPGDGINGILVALGEADNRPRFVQSRHEEMSAFEAVGYAKFSGRTGVCLATSGPGAVHLLNGLYDAKLDHVPVVAIVGQVARSAMGGNYQQEVDLHTLYKDVASDYLAEVEVPEQLPLAIDRAFRTAEAHRAPTAVIIPADLQEEPYSPPRHEFKHVPSSEPDHVSRTVVPSAEELARAAEVIDAGERVAILVGQGARGADAEIRSIADVTDAGVAKALLGKDVLDDDLPYVTGAIGLLGTRPSYELMRDCDTLLIVGSNLPYTQFYPEFGQARAVQIDLDGSMIGMRYPTEVNLVGDAGATLSALIPKLDRRGRRGWREKIERNVASWEETMEQQAMVEADPVNPIRVVHELSQRIPDDAIVTADSGSSTNWYARNLKFRGTMRGSLSGTLATMGCAVPYAIGAKFAHPQRPAIALVGDGAMQMNGLAELITIGRYRHLWEDPRLVVCVFNNGDLNQVTWELRAMGGAPKFEESQTLPRISYAEFARTAGLEGITVDRPEQLGGAWDRALAAEKPVVLDVHCDPNVPPIPPHATLEQIKSTTQALLKGDPDAWKVFIQGAKTKAQEMMPGRSLLRTGRRDQAVAARSGRAREGCRARHSALQSLTARRTGLAHRALARSGSSWSRSLVTVKVAFSPGIRVSIALSTSASGSRRSANRHRSRRTVSASTVTATPPSTGSTSAPKRASAHSMSLSSLVNQVALGMSCGPVTRNSPSTGTTSSPSSASAASLGPISSPSIARPRILPSPLHFQNPTVSFQSWSVSLIATSFTPSPAGWKVTSRSAKASRSAYHSGLSRSSLSTAAQEVTGQQSLSCHITAPEQYGCSERKYSMPSRSARAWLSWVKYSQSSKSRGSGRCASRPRWSLPWPFWAFWCHSMLSEAIWSGSSVTMRRTVAHVAGAW
nr:thiamine pyrophosphate-requiring protein [Glycomyces salinus]